jgi:type II restriction/modification system DNA methylase subunit YeeA
MNFATIEANIQKLIENFSQETFIYDFLVAYGTPKPTITLLKKGNRNLAKKDGQIILKNKLFFEEAKNQDPHVLIEELKNDPQTHKHKPKFIIVTDYKMLLAVDIKEEDNLETDILKLDKYFDFFLPLAGMKKEQAKNENLADIKAAYKMGKLYDEILKENPEMAKGKAHELNVFLSRLLFCFYAEYTDIFPKGIFTSFVKSHTQEDGSDLNTYLDRLFNVLNTQHREDLPDYLQQFPYVNGGLFAVKIASPKFTATVRKLITECGGLDWSEINPDIFGSMMQAVVDSEKRGGLGMHYTSVPNIMKVIEPLFLDELYKELEKSTDNINKLESLLKRISSIKIFDPACGSGNFLIIAYKELRSLEMEIIQHIQAIKGAQLKLLSNIKLSQFYGIEIDDFACETAKLSLWLAEHQMNKKFTEVFGIPKAMLPLQDSGKIVCANATRIDWETVCPKKENEEIYVLGNPPYLGSAVQNTEQKTDMAFVFREIEGYKNLL